MNIFLANSKEHNWDLCVKHNLFGIKERKKVLDITSGDLILMRISGSKDHGVKALWMLNKLVKVNSNTFVPWKDAEYGWIMECRPILTFKSLFKEDFRGIGGYSSKIPEFPASRIQPSLIQLKPNEFKAYFKHILIEYGSEVDLSIDYEGEKINFSKLLSGIAAGKPINYALQNSKHIINSPESVVKDSSLSEYIPQLNISASDKEDPESETVRSNIVVSRIIRDTALSIKIKSMYDSKCQLCGITIIAENGRKYAEAHHIQPLGRPHNGPDRQENIICLCPNCHVKLDYGIIELRINKIFTVNGHTLQDDFINYHNTKIYNKIFN